ncbi:filamin-binding LIM protein 1 [Hyla sarda]|uniref:filamin-binding LIM protein 1 n=1 Tax=Hyla sarda TaxID=327740 RepID=UPI0024C3068F|nr:filamin-binding LIM protein 1 [Hyla sarda]
MSGEAQSLTPVQCSAGSESRHRAPIVLRTLPTQHRSSQEMSGKRLVSSVQITLAPPWRAELSQKNQTPPQNTRAEQKRLDPPPVPNITPHHNDAWPDPKDLPNGDFPSFPTTFLDEIPSTEDLLSPDLPPPPPPPPVLLLSPKRVPLKPSPAPIPDSLNLELQKLELSRPPPSQKQAIPPLSQSIKPPLVPHNQQKREELTPGKQSVNGHRGKQEGSDICAFCHKSIQPSVPTIEAMKKQYHANCFTCRKCHRLLAGQMYYQKDGQPICDHCYKETLEKCAKCQTLILQHIVRALGNGYHPECFTCVVCNRPIADESFAVDEYNDVHCAEDYYRKYAPICGLCHQPIIPKNGQDSYKIECMGNNYHENCYRCEKCQVLLSLEPTDSGCFPLNGYLLCKSCHLSEKKEVS